jgi:hypothetical protein
VERVFSREHTNGFYITAAASCVIRDCWVDRTIANNGSAWDYFAGFMQDNTPMFAFFVSGNASTYSVYNAVHNAAGAFPGGTWGHAILGGFSDSFVHGLETAGTAISIEAEGNGTSGGDSTNEDLKITNCVFDVCSAFGVYVHNCNTAGQVIVSNCYMAPSGSGVGIGFDAFKGVATVMGNQVRATAGATATGIKLTSNSLGVSSIGNIITDCVYGEYYDDAGMCRSENTINSPNIVATAAVYLTGGSFRNVIKPVVNAPSVGNSGLGIKIDSGCDYNEVSPGGMNSGALAGGSSANKIVSNGAQIVAAGTFGPGGTNHNVALPGVYA